MSDFVIEVENEPRDEDRRRVFDGLHEFNAARTNDPRCDRLTVFLRDADGEIVGGLLGEIYWGWLNVESMWVDESLRRRGFGARLLAAAEREAVERGCRFAYLDTFGFQALRFYEKLGYETFGTLENFPHGDARYFMKKTLDRRDENEVAQ
ncbi:MAG TPA: GNAT family N-acetyltransferase [Pyrinomonadaceae bacterium]|jgi:GNAT superfamily N-acetyltransferase